MARNPSRATSPAARRRPRNSVAKKYTEAQDKAYDKAHGIKEGSKKDNALDKKRGVPVRAAPKGKK